ncbi:PaaX family transcriptional regulator [Aeromicrobium sp. CF3.5]|uniref:PaaX family transcriptional regulator n=1 Tax=Aeromicrobium sp. CF3.5 TaxID=3373078 RepID=UPI003EE5B8CD
MIVTRMTIFSRSEVTDEQGEVTGDATAVARVDFLESVRRQLADGPRPRQMVLTLLADYWLDDGAVVPSGALVDLAHDFDITVAGARAVLVRLSGDERVIVTREGRRTLYALTPWMRRRLGTGLDRMRRFGEPDQHSGRWTCVAFSVPEEQRAARYKLRTGLHWLGFAPWYDGLWVSPAPTVAAAAALIEGLGISTASVFEADMRATTSAAGRPVDAWDLDGVRSTYEQLIAEMQPVLDLVRSGSFDDVDALVWRTQLVNVWRTVPTLDPGLPQEVLPTSWPRERAREMFEEIYRTLSAPALTRVHRAVARHAPHHVVHARCHDLGLTKTLADGGHPRKP